jgi:hypothetical protein
LNYRRWLLVGYLLVLMAFATSVLLIPGERYRILTTSDSGFFLGVAREIENNNGLVERYSLSHAPYGLPIGVAEQGQPLISVMLYRAVRTLNPNIELMDIAKYWGMLLFALTLIPIFLIGKELSDDVGGCAAAFFGATLTSSIYWHKVGAFDREPIMLILAAWTIYLTMRMLKAPRSSIPKFALLAGLVFGIFGLSWGGALYLIPILIGGMVLILFVKYVEKLFHRFTDFVATAFSVIRENLHIIAGTLGILAVMTFVLWVLGGVSPMFWMGFVQMLLRHAGVGVGVGVGVTFPPYAGEMATPGAWGDIINKFYHGPGDVGLLTTFTFALIALALLKFCWSRKHWELLAFPWLIVLAAMVWPGAGGAQIRFERQWWPLVPVLAGVGVAVLVSIIRRLSFEQFGEWLKHFQNPVVVALGICLITTPFIFNANAVAGRVTPPTEWRGIGFDEAYIEAFDWLRENTPENSVVAIQWSFGHLLTGVSERPTVVDGTETMGEEGKWENVEGIIRPPDYIFYTTVRNGMRIANIYGKHNVLGERVRPRPYAINGRRIDIHRLVSYMGADEARWLLRTYRENFGCRIDYIVFDFDAYRAGLHEIHIKGGDVIRGAGRIAQLRTVMPEDGLFVFNFGENRQRVVLNLQTHEVYLEQDDVRLHLDGYAFFVVDNVGRVVGYGGFRPYPNPVIPETMVIDINQAGAIVSAHLIESATRLIGAIPTPLSRLVFEGNVGGIDYLQDVFASRNGLVRVFRVIHENLQ